MDFPFLGKNVSWRVIVRRAAGLLVLLFFLNFILLVAEILTNTHFSVLPFQEYSVTWRIGLTLFWLVFWLLIYRALGGFQKKKS